VVKPKFTFKQVKWHPTDPAEDFSFFDVRVAQETAHDVSGYIYFPHPETKPKHFQSPNVLELLLPFLSSIGYGARLRLAVPTAQMRIELSADPNLLTSAGSMG
jgi:hypothetical protein